MKFYKAIAAVFGIGYISKGGGSVAAAAYCLFLYFKNGYSVYLEITLLILVVALGIVSASVLEKDWGKDSSKVVIDEVAGMMVSLAFVPVTIPNLIAAFVLFRFFDILKPLGIRKTEKLPSGWGVMADDILSGVYARILLMVFMGLKLF